MLPILLMLTLSLHAVIYSVNVRQMYYVCRQRFDSGRNIHEHKGLY